MEENYFISKNCGLAVCENFSEVYARINHDIMSANEKWDESRDGNVKEVLNFTTQITNPYRRCVGGYRRNMNVFFLLAEAMWIAVGKQDVEFLSIFNSNMPKYSDNGVSFHAPYGYRLRHWGVASDSSDLQNNDNGFDQIREAVRILHENPNSRQVVMSIWNPKLDLGFQTKDIPCNDILMLKIRDGKLVTTIANRSNDLHFGLPTNIFQFSFITEIIASCLGIELGTQTHNSQSLHVYDWNKIAIEMDDLYNKRGSLCGIPITMYCNPLVNEKKMDFAFVSDLPSNRLNEITYYLNMIITEVTEYYKGAWVDKGSLATLEGYSKWFYAVYRLLCVYVDYSKTARTESDKRDALFSIVDIEDEICADKDEEYWDVMVLAKNFFYNRLGEEQCFSINGNL